MAAREDILFRRFHAQGDTGALAEVFDRTAPEILRVALHLTGNLAEAEDLLQATFLEAMECAASYDATRRLMPWMLGILVNQARLVRRRRARTLDGARVAVPGSPDPLVDAQTNELRAALDRAIRTLPESYRDVFALALHRGLSAAEIARSLGRPQGTVRSQLVRGWDLLRRSLPPGFAISALMWATSPRGLATVRAIVLARAEATAAAAVQLIVPSIASMLGTAMLTKKTLLVGPVVLLLASGLCLFWPAGAHDGSDRPTPPFAEAANPTGGQDASERAVRTLASHAGQRLELATGTSAATLRVRVTWASGEPARGIGLAVRPVIGMWAELEERQLRTDATGCVEVDDLRPGRISVRTDRSAWTTVDLGAGELRDLALRIPAAVTVRGVVLGAGRVPLTGAELYVSEYGDPAAGMVAGRSGSDGSFVLPDLANGRFVAAFASGHAASLPREVAGQEGGTVELELELTPSPGSLRGRVVDAAGSPVANAAVLVGRAVGTDGWAGSRLIVERPPRRLRSDGDGRFAVSGGIREGTQLWVRAPGFALWKGYVPAPHDDLAEVNVSLCRGGRVRGVFRDDAGRPLANCSVSAGAFDREAPEWGRLSTLTGPDGGFGFEGVTAGRVELCASPPAGERVCSTLEIAEGEARTWDPVARRGLEIRGRVVDEQGAGLAGFRVEAELPAGVGETTQSTGDGEFVLAGLHASPYRLSVHDPAAEFRFIVASLPDVQAGRTGVIVRVRDDERATARIVGIVLGPGGAPVPRSRVTVLREPFAGGPLILTDARTGAFDTGLVPPGRYRLSGLVAGHPVVELGEHVVAPRQRLDLGSRQLQAPATLDLILSDPVANGRLFVRDLEDRFVASCAIKNGSARAAPLSPGRYRVTGWGKAMSPFALEVEVRVGEMRKVEVEVLPGVERSIRFVGPVDQALDLRVAWRNAAGTLLWQDGGTWRADQAATTRKTFAPGTYSVEAVSDDGRLSGRATFIVTAEASDAVVPVPVR